MVPRREIAHLYERLRQTYGPQGWWPLLAWPGINPTRSGTGRGYHPGDYSFPRTPAEQFEICCGAILTQNTAWPNVEKALLRMRAEEALAPDAILELAPECLGEIIRPSGYYRVKAEKLRRFAEFYRNLRSTVPGREALLAVWGIGPETADSMLLYAFHQPEMVIDAYTRRILTALKLIRGTESYEAIKQLCATALPRELAVYQEFHALMVEHAKRHSPV